MSSRVLSWRRSGWHRTAFGMMAILVAVVALTCECAHVATLPCGSTIPIDSQFIFDPIWSLTPYRNSIRKASGVNMQVSKESISRAIHNVVKSEAGMDPNAVTIFRLQPQLTPAVSSGTNRISGNSNDSGDFSTEGLCTIHLDPLKAGLAGTRATAARLVFLEIRDSVLGGCMSNISVSVTLSDTTSTLVLRQTSSSPFTQGISIGGSGNGDGDAIAWPGAITFPSACEMQVLLLTNRHGRVDTWYTWIPTTVYTAVVTALILPALLVNRRMPTGLIGLEITLVFLGYLGSCVGLVVELICWQSSLGRMFPFPSSVTLYTCLCVLYALYLLPLVYRRHGHYRVLLMGVLRLLVYGLNSALCVGYWISGYVLLGSLALFQYVVTNLILTLYYARITVRLRNLSLEGGTSVKFAHVFTYLWFVPATPFAACGLMYSDLYSIAKLGETKRPEEARMRDVVYAYNAQMSLPLLFFQNIYGVALVAAATAFHMPFIVALFAAVWLCSLHLICSCDAYVREYRRWRARGVVNLTAFTSCGWLLLTPIMDFLLNKAKKDPQSINWGDNRDTDGNAGFGRVPFTQGGGEIVYNNAGLMSSPHSVDQFSPGAAGMSDRRRQTSAFLQQPALRQEALSTQQQGAVATDVNGDNGGAANLGNSGLIYFPPAPTRGADRIRMHTQPEDAVHGANLRGAEEDNTNNNMGTPINQRTVDPANPQFWPTSVER